MTGDSQERRNRENNFGALRLVLASLVIVGHVPMMIDGNTSRELLTQVLGGDNFAAIGVDGFFTISGFLIARSFLSPQNTLPRFIASRVLRIYPGYLVAYLISVYVFGYFAGGDMSYVLSLGLVREAGRMLFLLQPDLPGTFPGLPDHHLNGPMWSLAQEFRCYATVVLLGLLGIYSRHRIFLTICIACVLVLLHPPFAFARMFSIFTCGSAFYICREKISYRLSYCLLAFAGWCVVMHFTRFGEIATATFLAYVIFYIVFEVKIPWLSQIGRTTDVSYGMYLYSWPISNFIIYYNPAVSPWLVIVITLVTGTVAGFVSWKLIEQPALQLKSGDWFGTWLKTVESRL